MADITNIFGGAFAGQKEAQTDPPEQQVIAKMIDAGLQPPEQIIMDGQIHRFKSGTKGRGGYGDKTGWYIIFPDGIPAGRFGCWRAGIEQTFRADIGRTLTEIEEMAHARRMGEAQKKRDRDRARLQENVGKTVEKIWVDGGAADEPHPYLTRKGIESNGARVTGDGRLIIPMYNAENKITSIQYISADGTKVYHTGGKTGGSFWQIGTLDEPGVLYIAEGFATAATIFEETNRPCVIAYSASNIPAVTGIMRSRHGDQQEIVIVADNDASGVGKRYADEAGAKHGARVVMPPIEGMDANDYVREGYDLKDFLVHQNGDSVVKKLKVVFGNDLGDDYEMPDELVEGLIVKGSSTVLYGDSNSGKTFLAMAIAKAIAEGDECFGRKTEKGLVVYLATEAPNSIKTRMQAMKKYFGCELSNFAMVPVPLNFYSGDGDANDVIEMVSAIESAKGQPVQLIIGDTLARMSAGANENSGEDMGPVMARFDRVASSTGAANLIIHHNGKDAAKGARGWSGIRAHIDTEIEVVEKDGARSFAVTKQRELPGKNDVTYFKLEIIEMGRSKFGGMATTCVAVPDEQSQSAQPHKKPSRHDENMRTLERAWWDSGAEERNGSPYVSRSALKNLLIKDGAKDRTAENKVKPSNDKGVIAPLINAEVISPYEHGWIFIQSVQVSSMLMRKNGNK